MYIEQTQYNKNRDIINKLGHKINTTLKGKLNKLILKDCGIWNDTLNLYLVIDCDKDVLMDNYYMIVDDVVDVELDESIIISIYPYTTETFKAVMSEIYITDNPIIFYSKY